MTSKKLQLSRRTFLRGSLIGGATATLGLPVLEAMLDINGEALAQDQGDLPMRYIVAFAGTSLGTSRGGIGDRFIPTSYGQGYGMTDALMPLQTRDVRDQVSIISNLKLPSEFDDPMMTQQGVRTNLFHGGVNGPLLTATRSSTRSDVGGISSDQVVANAWSKQTLYDSLVARVQAATYIGDGVHGHKGYLSYKDRRDPIVPYVDPYSIYTNLFSGFTPSMSTDVEIEALRQQHLRKRGVVDAVLSSYDKLNKKLGATDKIRMEKHMSELRDIEQQLQRLYDNLDSAVSSCELPGAPNQSWPVATGQGLNRHDNFNTEKSYSNEIERSEIITNLLYMAMKCDITRVASLQYTFFQSFMSAKPFSGENTDIHEIGHSSRSEALVDIVTWHVDQFAMLAERLKSSSEGGGTMLDRTAALLVFEGGYGFDPETGQDGRVHSTENMVMLSAGGAGGMKRGEHLDGLEHHPGSVMLSAIRAVGVNTDRFGEVRDTYDPLIG
jgi:hypothetical protein